MANKKTHYHTEARFDSIGGGKNLPTQFSKQTHRHSLGSGRKLISLRRENRISTFITVQMKSNSVENQKFGAETHHISFASTLSDKFTVCVCVLLCWFQLLARCLQFLFFILFFYIFSPFSTEFDGTLCLLSEVFYAKMLRLFTKHSNAC